MAEVRLTGLIVQGLASKVVTVEKEVSGGGGGVDGGAGDACIPVSTLSDDRVENVIRLPDSQLVGAPPEVEGVKKKRGRPPRNPASAGVVPAAVVSSAAVVASKRSKEPEEEDVCFICFDGGSLVICDRRDCPKAYHPACVKRDEAFFRPNIRWDCGWHLCNICQRNAIFMCYTCPYSLCKRCVKEAEIFSVRGNKGFCKTCMSTIKLIEKIRQENVEVVQIDFDDTANWEYLFKMYWIFLKERENLTLDELTRASNPYKAYGLGNKYTYRQKIHDPCFSNASELTSSSAHCETNVSKRRKTGRQQQPLYMESQKTNKAESNKVSCLGGQPDWASKELLEFVAHMKNGDTSFVPHFDVQALLLDYIKKNNLRDPRQKCQIICDKRLELLFGKDRVGHFEVLKLLEYHFKEESRTNGVIRGASIDSISGQGEGLTVENEIPSRETRAQNRRKGDDKSRQINLDKYAAIDGHNINLIYLKRGLLETLTAKAETFHDKVVGSVVRIKISSSDQKQDMHRLVRIIGTDKITTPYKIGDSTGNLMLKILNLNKIEDVSLEAISDQEFSEDECRRLRQSIKLGLVESLTVGDIQKKTMALQEIRVDNWLETEIRRLNLLRDRASEMGHKKEHREYVEKIEALKSPEERQRRIHEVPEVHSDPRMDPSYGSDDDSGDSDSKGRDSAWTPKYSKSHGKRVESIYPLKVGDISKNGNAKTLKAVTANGERKRKHSSKLHVGGVNGALGFSMPSQKTEGANAASKVPKIESRTDASVASSDHKAPANGSISQAVSEPVSDVIELEKIWYYRDPAGKVQGPFCLLQLRKWDSSGFFPIDLRVWKHNETYDKSILLADALRKQLSNEPYFQQNSYSQSHNGDHEKGNSVGAMSSNSVASSIGDQTNDECSKSNSTDIASTPEANKHSVNGYSDAQDGNGNQISVQNLKAQLIESLFHIEEPSPDATVSRSPEVIHADLKLDPIQLSSVMTMSDYADAKSCQAVKSATSSPDAGKPDFGTSLPSTSVKVEASEPPKHYISPNVLGFRTPWSTEFSLFPSIIPSNNTKANNNTVNEQDLNAIPKMETDGLKAPIIENKGISTSGIPGQVSGISWSNTITSGIEFSDIPTSSLKLDMNHCPQGQDPGISWSTATSIGDEVHLPDVAEWGMYSANSCSSAKLGDLLMDHTTPTTDSCHKNFDILNWQPIELSVLGDDSVSDLLSEVEAMENLRSMSDPSARIDCGDDLIGFSPIEGLSPNIDAGKNDMEFHILPSHSDQLNESFHVDVCEIQRTSSSILSSLGLATEPEPTPVITHHNFVSQAPVSSLLPPSPHNFVSQAPVSSSALSEFSPPQPSMPLQDVVSEDHVSSLISSLPLLQTTPLTLSPAVTKLASPQAATKSPSPLPVATKSFSPAPAATKSHLPPPISAESPSLLFPPPPEADKPLSPPQIKAVAKKPPSAVPNLPSPPPPSVAKLPSPPPPPPPVAQKLPSPPPLPAAQKLPSPSPPAAQRLPSPSPPPQAATQKLPSPSPPPPSTAQKLPSPSPPPAAAQKLSSPPPPASQKLPSQKPRPSPLSLNSAPSSQEGLEMDPTKNPARPQEAGSRGLRSPQNTKKKQGSKNTTNEKELPGQPNGKFPSTGSILGSPNMHWTNSGQPIPSPVGVNPHWSPSVQNQGPRMTQTSPRYTHNNNAGRHPGPKDRIHHHGVDPGFSKNRPTPWNRQPSSRPPNRGPRVVCKFHENGYCRHGATCKFLHP